ncbi:hypothetical protein [uncultured Aquimarina sp.]|uniref:hypothetical protein n=1 Tax=uncultured Aquimarina sp. TaxID=575652 RepID=UPI002632C047|nr:hypothetical protein [uncultured Aquimarina sp.]
MKRFIYLLLVFSPLFIKAQAQNTTKKVTPPKIITKLKIGKKVNFKTKSIQFVKVVEDSRCPTYVTCVWEGQAKVIIGIYENDTLLEQKLIIIGAKGITPSNNKEILKSEDQTIYGYNLSPHPSGDQKTDPSEYYLEMVVK